MGLPGHFIVFCNSVLVDSDFTYAPTCYPDDPARWEPINSALQASPESTIDEGGATVLATVTPTKWEQGFRVCDPGTSNPLNGAYIFYNESYSFTVPLTPKRLIDVSSIMVVGP